LVQSSDENGTAPDSSIIESLLAPQQPVVILVDELVAYVRQFEEGKSYAGGTFDSNLTFIQNLTQALKAVPKAMLLVSLPESRQSEAGSARGQKAMDRIEGTLSRESLEKTFGRIHAIWKPVATEEAFEIVRRRLFTKINDQQQAEAVCRAFADFYVSNAEEFPQDTQESRYFDRLTQAYPIHPEIFDRLYEDWSSLDNFQRTRGVLKFMAKVIYRLWKDGNNDLLIMPGSLPLYDADVRNEAIYYLPQGWDPVVEGDIDGERAEATEIEAKDTRFGSLQACRRSARTIFLGSAPSSTNQTARGIDFKRVALGVAQPTQQLGIYSDALRRLSDRLHYLNSVNDRYWFDTRPNLRREMEERKRRYHNKEHVFPAVRDRLEKSFAPGAFGGAHVFTPSSDVPDDWKLHLVVLPLDSAYSRGVQNNAIKAATDILTTRGDQPRLKQNRLIFLAADYDTVSRLEDQICSMLAWQSIVEDIKELRLNLDQLQARQANKSLDDSNEAVRRTIREVYKWLLTPMQEARPGKGLSEVQWESFPVNPGAANLTLEIERVLRENELLITEWAPVHLNTMLKTWFWKNGAQDVSAMETWQKTCQYLYLPRLKDDMVFRSTLIAGSDSREFFGMAQAKDGDRYIGFTFGRSTLIVLDSTMVLIEPNAAAAYDAAQKAAQKPVPPVASPISQPGTTSATASEPGAAATAPRAATVGPLKRRFYASVQLDPIVAKKQFSDIVDEVLLQFTSRPSVTVRVAIDIQAESSVGFDDALQRAVKENCNVLKFGNSDFETGE
jgi:predicted AAA+ superfamily ATPase